MKIEATPRGLLTVFFRQRAKLVNAFLVVMLCGISFILLAKPEYESAGTVLVRFGNDAKPDVDRPDRNPTEVSQNDRSELLESYVQILQSHDLLLSLVNEFGVNKIYPDLAVDMPSRESPEELAIRRLVKRDLSVKANPLSNTIDLKLLNRNPQMAQQFAHRLLEQFITRQAEVYNKPQINFITEQLGHTADELAQAQQKLQDFKAKTGLSSIDEEINELLRQKSDENNNALQDMSKTQSKLDDLKAKESKLRSIYQDDSSPVKEVRESIAITQQQLYARKSDLQTATNLTPGTDDKTRHYSSTHAAHIADIDKRISEIEAQRNEFNDLQRQVQMAGDNYKSYQSRLEEARANESLNQENITRISVLNEPVIPRIPAKPDKPFILLLCAISGMLLGFGLALVFETLDERFSRPEQLTVLLDVPVMASFDASGKRRAV